MAGFGILEAKLRLFEEKIIYHIGKLRRIDRYFCASRMIYERLFPCALCFPKTTNC